MTNYRPPSTIHDPPSRLVHTGNGAFTPFLCQCPAGSQRTVRYHTPESVCHGRTLERKGTGFTLVELLVTTSLMAMVGGAAVAALAGGLRVWDRATSLGTDQQAMLIAFERMRRDLHNLRRFAPIQFEGDYHEYAFPVVEAANADSNAPKEIGRLGYFHDERRQLLCRSFAPYRLLRHERLTDHCQPVLEGLTRVRFKYFGKDSDSGTAGWMEHWSSLTPPLAVSAEMTLRPRGQPPTTHTVVIDVLNSAEPPPAKDKDETS